MSKSIPYFDFYPADFMHGVRGLTPAEVGVYTMLLCRIYEENGPVEYHVARLATYCGMREAVFEKTFARLVDLGKISLDGGHFSNGRAQQEIASRETKLKNNSRAGKISAEKRQQKQSRSATDVQRNVNHTDTDTDTDKNKVTDVTYCPDGEARAPSFDEFWSEWPLGKIGKDAARKAFSRLSAKHRAEAAAGARVWATGWRQANPRLNDIHPSTYLNNKRWTDEAQPSLTVINGGTIDQSPQQNRRISNADASNLAIAVAGATRRAPDPSWF